MTAMPYLSKEEKKAIDKLKAHYGGAKEIMKTVEERRDYKYRLKTAQSKGFGKYLDEAEQFAAQFPKIAEYKTENKIKITKKGVGTTQVSAWQGCKITHNCMKRVAEAGNIFLPKEMISVMALTDDYVYSGDLLATLAMCENIMGGRFCNTSFVGTALPAHRFENISKATGVKIETIDAGNGLRAIQMRNQGTPFGNLCGLEVGNDNHLVYLDSITRTALETGSNFFLNPSWSTIAAACYYARDLTNLSFKISCFLAVQNLIQFRMLLNIIKEYLRADGTSPVKEVNMGNAVSPEKFVEAYQILKASKIKGISLTAHIRINADLGMADFKWIDNALKVLDCACDMTMKYESDGQCTADDTIASYFLSKEEREAKAEILGEVLFRKVLCCSNDAKMILKTGHDVKFAEISEPCKI